MVKSQQGSIIDLSQGSNSIVDCIGFGGQQTGEYRFGQSFTHAEELVDPSVFIPDMKLH